MRIHNIICKNYLCRPLSKILFYNFNKKNGYLCVCVCVCVKDISQTFNSEYVGENCKLVGERESRKPSVFIYILYSARIFTNMQLSTLYLNIYKDASTKKF